MRIGALYTSEDSDWEEFPPTIILYGAVSDSSDHSVKNNDVLNLESTGVLINRFKGAPYPIEPKFFRFSEGPESLLHT